MVFSASTASNRRTALHRLVPGHGHIADAGEFRAALTRTLAIWTC